MARSQVDIVRVRLWYLFIEHKLRQNTPYGVEKIIEPNSFRKNGNGDTIRNNRWGKYYRGLHTPTQKIIDLVEPFAPESTKILNHVIWKIIESKQIIGVLNTNSVKELSWDIQKILYKYRYNLEVPKLKERLTYKDILSLQRKAGLDSLAAQVLFLKDAYSKDKKEDAFHLGRSIYQTLLILCTEIPFRKMSTVLILLMEMHIFPMTSNGNKRIKFQYVQEFSKNIIFLSELFLTFEDALLYDFRKKNSLRVKSDILEGKFGLDLILKFSPPTADV
ncbi:hypothetical protein AS4_08360 [Acinetobacter guillouiae]|uniref:hypothetical protein n=1 Tax=Acinetobacter guillouiae TaxID=106649 RepID=UPI0004EF66B5|nr:hypothetical protein [Acinetobacter guillouiae]BAP35776.1 hypothetical protein AS4_08360 [Acinetobacter guillouiae]